MDRIYLVKTPAGEQLVRAFNKTVAINHVVDNTITAEVASQDDLIRLVSAGVKVQDSKPASQVVPA